MALVDPALLQSIVTEALKLVLVVLGLLSAYIVKLFAEKLKVSITDTQKAKLEEVAVKAVWYAEEMAAKQVQAGYSKDVGKLKRSYAWQYLQREAGTVAPQVFDRLIHTVLGETKGLGASRDVGRAG